MERGVTLGGSGNVQINKEREASLGGKCSVMVEREEERKSRGNEMESEMSENAEFVREADLKTT